VPEHDEALAAELRELGALLRVGEAADQRAAVRARLTAARPAPRRARRWIVAAVTAIVGVVAVVAPARAAVVAAVDGLLRIAGIEVRVDPEPGALPATPGPLPSQRTGTLDEARRVARFPLRTPAELGAPSRVSTADPGPEGAPRVVTLEFRAGAVRLDEFDGALSPVFLKTAPAAQWTTVGGSTGIWLPGPHPVTYVDREGAERTETARLATPTLIWSAGPVSYRLEGIATLPEALRIAESLR
jgi:hypothetical protein